MKIGFIGLGVMGKSMVINLIKHNFNVEIYARNKNKVQDLINVGIRCYDTIGELVKENDVIITIVGYPQDVKEVYFGDDKILTNVKKGSIVIDMTTSSPSLASDIYKDAKNKGLFALDCPVTGGDLGAKNGTLTIFGGGDKEIFEKVKSILLAMGTTIYYVGEAGMGQHAKLANQIAIAGAISAVSEIIAYSRINGLNAKELVNIWASGSAGSWQLKNMAPRALDGDLQPGFYIKHFIKDMELALEESRNKGLDLKMLTTVNTMFRELASKGYNELGTQAIVDYYK